MLSTNMLCLSILGEIWRLSNLFIFLMFSFSIINFTLMLKSQKYRGIKSPSPKILTFPFLTYEIHMGKNDYYNTSK